MTEIEQLQREARRLAGVINELDDELAEYNRQRRSIMYQITLSFPHRETEDRGPVVTAFSFRGRDRRAPLFERLDDLTDHYGHFREDRRNAWLDREHLLKWIEHLKLADALAAQEPIAKPVPSASK
jgi:hypothetical protein